MDARPQPGMKFEVGKPIAIQLNDGSFLRGFVHAEDKGAALLCLELIPSAQVALVSTVNIKSVSPLTLTADTRKWPSNCAYYIVFLFIVPSASLAPPTRWSPSTRIPDHHADQFQTCQEPNWGSPSGTHSLTVHVDLAKLRAEERRTYEKRETEFNKLGVGVSPSAQAIFDTLAKTMPCKWDGEHIVILDTVRLAPPYNAKGLR